VDNPAQLEEWTVDYSGKIILECKKCGEHLTLLGLEEDWLSEGRTEFECNCGKWLTLGRDRSYKENHEAAVGVRGVVPSIQNRGS
jgi:hypothetical protein